MTKMMNNGDGISQFGELEHYCREVSSSVSRFYIDEDIGEPKYYRPLIQALLSAGEDDVIEIWINSAGGQINTTESITSAMSMCEGRVIAIINGSAYSAASIIALSAQELVVLPTASMMCHEAQYGTSGKGSDIRGYADFTEKKLDVLMENAYEGFLTTQELTALKNGKEFWFLADEIVSRLNDREAHYANKLKKQEKLAKKEMKKLKKLKKMIDFDVVEEVE